MCLVPPQAVSEAQPLRASTATTLLSFDGSDAAGRFIAIRSQPSKSPRAAVKGTRERNKA